MRGHDATGGREPLGFADAVERSFAWLEGRGFLPVEKTPTLVRYRSRVVEVTIYHGRSSFEVGVEVGRVSGVERFSMAELLRFEDETLASGYRNPSASTAATVARFVGEQSERLRRHGRHILAGDDSVWVALTAARGAWSRQYASEVAFAEARSEAHQAFRARGFPKVLKLLNPFERRLGLAERRMLSLAHQRSWGARISRAILFSASAIVSLLWTVYFLGMGFYGVYLSWWGIPLVLGSLVNLCAAAQGLLRAGRWSAWLQLVGSTVLAVFWAPASLALLDLKLAIDSAWLAGH